MREYITYLIHFSKPVKHARHYLGSTRVECFKRRMQEHCRGDGSRLLKRALAADQVLYIARIWQETDRSRETTIKRSGHLPRYCPICVKGLVPELTTCQRLTARTLPVITPTSALSW